jgi:hypothetical protein
MNIRFTSSLTPEDESLFAPAILRAVSSILDLLPIAYNIRIETADSQIFQHTSPTSGSPFDSASAQHMIDEIELA